MPLFAALVLVVALLSLWWASARSRELAVLQVRDGRLSVQRGGLPHGLIQAFADIATRAGVQRATLRVLRDGEHARLVATGLPELALQRARNVLGTYPLARLRSAPRHDPGGSRKRAR